MARKKKTPVRRKIRCYLCGRSLEVSAKAMSSTCPGCNRAIKIEDVIVKSYVPVIELQTCGKIKVTKRGRVAAKHILSGDGIDCEGSIDGCVETEGKVKFGPKAVWRGKTLQSRSLAIADGATLQGDIIVPWSRAENPADKT